MSCGQKAWAEEIEAENYARTLQKFSNLSVNKVIGTLETAVDDLERFIASDPSLTRVQWARIDNTLKILKELI